MIAKGNTHDDGAKLGRYLINGKENERAELWQLRGFAELDIVDAFRSVHIMAEATQCEKPFFHVQVRNPLGDRALSHEEWEIAADRIQAKIGYEGQPRAIAFHVDKESGQEHMHIAWSRIDDATLKARPLPFYKLRLKEVSRELEESFDLTRVRNERRANEPRTAKRSEAEQARRLEVDGKAIRQTIRDAYERSDNGQSLQHALADEGLILARGDRRAFVVIDQAGGIHALNGRLLEDTAKQVSKRLADLDPAALPSVEEARAQQARPHSRTHQPPPREIAEPEPQRAEAEREAEARPLNKTQGEIRLAYSLTEGGQAFADALEDRGIHLARVTTQDIAIDLDASEEKKPLLSRHVKAGDLVAVNAWGSVYTLNPRVTGDSWRDLTARLAEIDTAPLLSVTETREVTAAVQEQRREAWKQARAEERARAQAERRAEYVKQRSAQLEDNPTAQEIGLAYAQTRTGDEFVAVLEERGLVVARVTEDDAERSRTQRDYGQRTPLYEAGDYVALNERGQAFHLDGTTIHDHEETIFARLAEIDASEQLTLTQARQVVEHWREAPEPAREAVVAPRVKETAGRVAAAAGLATGIAGNFLGGVMKHLAEPLLGALTDFFTAPSKPVPEREAAAQRAQAFERTQPPVNPQQRERMRRMTPETAVSDPEVQQQARAGNALNMPIEIQEAIRRRAREIEDARRDRERSRDR